MSQQRTLHSGGIPILGFVFLIFLTLKLAEIGAVANWSWWAVTAPLWGIPAILLAVVAVLMVVAGICRATEAFLVARKRKKVAARQK